MATLKGKLAEVGGISGTLSSVGGLSAKMNVPRTPSPYTGTYTVTPTNTTQILNTSGLVMNDNVTIDPIPSNYGLITYNGGIITVS